MRPAPLRSAAATFSAPAQPQRYLTNDEAADYLRLSPRTLEKQRVIGGGPRFRKFGRSIMLASGRYAMLDDGLSFTLVPWKPVIEQRFGQQLAATVRGGTVLWEFGRGLGR